MATHNHFVLDRGGKVFKQSAPVIKLPADATEDDYLDLLGVLNSSTACFWLRQVCHGKGNGGVNEGMRGEDWEEFFEFTGTKLQEFPLPSSLPRERARVLDGLAVSLGVVSPSGVVGGSGSLGGLAAAHREWDAVRARMVFAQEELDWGVYWAYGLLDADLTYAGSGVDAIVLGSRAFEIALARSVESGSESTHAGEQVSIPVPPKYKPVDFRKTSYWQARGKLDVPKERFVLYPGAERAGDSSVVVGWAGWDHLEQARALATLIFERQQHESWSGEQVLPLVAGLVELEPWLHQWFDAVDPLFSGSPAAYLTGLIDQQLSAAGKTRDDCKAWRPI